MAYFKILNSNNTGKKELLLIKLTGNFLWIKLQLLLQMIIKSSGRELFFPCVHTRTLNLLQRQKMVKT